MLHYCSVEDIQGLSQVAPRFASNYQTVRDAVTGLFNAFLRRDLSYSDNVIQYVDAITLGRGAPYIIHLDKKSIDPDLPVDIRYHRDRLWDNGAIVTGARLDYEKGTVTLYGPMSFGKDTIRIQYAGGFKEIMKPGEGANPPTATGVMDCPAPIKLAAIQQANFMLRDLLENETGNKQSDRGKTVVQKEKTIEGLLPTVARALNPWRKTYARVI